MIFSLLLLVSNLQAAEISAKYAVTAKGQKEFAYKWDAKERNATLNFAIKGSGNITNGSHPVKAVTPIEYLGCFVKGSAELSSQGNEFKALVKLELKGPTCEFPLLGYLSADPMQIDIGGNVVSVHGSPFQICSDTDSCEKKNGDKAVYNISGKHIFLAAFDGKFQSWRDERTGLVWGNPEMPFKLNQAEAEKYCIEKNRRLPKTIDVPDDEVTSRIFKLIGANDVYWTNSKAYEESKYVMAWNFSANSFGLVGVESKYGVICVYDAN